ncbi:SDR family oxidoreductase [Reinekea sp.]|uniref:SDR family oxidoreductase n=1 Tax=Reinekea sp. TaxID=1970455 RepID=UPI003988F22F
MIKHSPSLCFCVLGSNTQIGHALCDYLLEREIPFTALDLDDQGDVALCSEQIKEAYIVNTLPEELPSGLVMNEDQLLKVTEKLAAFCQSNEKVLFQISSASVFDGQKKTSYKEADATHPITESGQLLLKCEHKAQQRCVSTVILRTSWLFSDEGDNYLTRLCNAAVSEQQMRFSGSMKACPTNTLSIAKAFVAMAEQIDCRTEPALWGVYHYVDSDACSMFTFAKTAITVIKSMADVKIETIEELTAEEGGINESYELSCRKILSAFGIKRHPWRRGLHDTLKQKYASSGSVEVNEMDKD